MAGNEEADNGSDALTETIDERKIETAIKFLQNVKVKSTPMARRISFLQQKGLNKAEINAAIGRSGSVEYEPSKVEHNNTGFNPQQQFNHPQVSHINNRPGWSSIVLTAILGGGVAYVMNRIVKVYVAPLFLGKDKKDHFMERIIKSMKSFEEKHIEMASGLKTSFDNIENLLEKQQLSLNTLKSAQSTQTPMTDVIAYSEIKSELTSMKSLLLARNQFPPTPFSPSSSGATIPAWQKAAALKKQITSERKSASDSELPNGDHQPIARRESPTTEQSAASPIHGTVKNGISSADASSDEEPTSLPNPTISSTFVKVGS